MAQEPDEVTSDAASDAATPGAGADSEAVTTTELRSQIDQTRAQMSQTIDAIHDRLRPGRLMTDARETVKEATIGRVKQVARRSRHGGSGSFVMDETLATLRKNPIPVALIGAAATVLIARAFSSRTHHDVVAPGLPFPPRRRQRPGSNRISRTRAGRFLVATGAGLACWGAWRSQRALTS